MNEYGFKDKVDALIARLKKQGFPVWSLKVAGGRFQRPGIPDFLLCVRGCFVAVELKNPQRTGRLSKKQALELAAIAEAGGIALSTTEFAEVEAAIMRILRGMD